MLLKMQYRIDIQVLRGIAVIAVVLFHTNQNWFPLGYLGVDVFFVISGYVVTPLILRIFDKPLNLKQTIIGLKDFFIGRFYRLAPALAATIIFSGFILILLDPFLNQQNFARQGISALLLIGNFAAYKYSGDYFSPNPNPLIHTWSLSVEEQIYIFLPIVLTIIIYKGKNLFKQTIYVFLSVTIVSVVSFTFPILLNPIYLKLGIQTASQISFYSPLDRIWQFTIGGLVFLLAPQIKLGFKNTKFFKIVNLILSLTLIFLLLSSFQINEKLGSILASIFTLLIILLRSLIFTPRYLSLKFEWLGNRSYSIYLVHMPAIYVIDRLFKRFSYDDNYTFIQLVSSVTASILLGTLSYSKIENKFRNMGKIKNITLKNKIISVALTFILPVTFLLPLGLNSSNNMYRDRLDDGLCKFWTPTLDSNFYSRYKACNLKFGKALIVLGDSHALNIYNTLFLARDQVFLVGISRGGCRPKNKFNFCPYSDFEKFIQIQSETIGRVLFHQSGSYLISDLKGSVDSDLAFRNSKSFKILNQDIDFLSTYLNKMAQTVPTTWLGPFPEARINSTLPEVWARKIHPNPVVKLAFLELENQINFTLQSSQHKFDYISLVENLGKQQYQIQIGNCLMFRDKDHWSLCAEKIYSDIFKVNNIINF